MQAGEDTFEVFAGPYSFGCDIIAPLVSCSTLDELNAVHSTGNVLLLSGDLAVEQLMPKHFPFYNPEHHQGLYRLLEEKSPVAILAATTQNPDTAGALYPFPLFEDGDFDIPNAYMTAEEGRRLAGRAGQAVRLRFDGDRRPAEGWNIVAAKGRAGAPRIVLTAHIDAKDGTPGALDNASGVTTLLLLAVLLSDYAGPYRVELTAINGEDYYAGSGEVAFIQANEDRFEEILLGINLDGAGYRRGRTAYSLYGCNERMQTKVQEVFADPEHFIAGPAWYQSDHFLFILKERPALAFTSEAVDHLVREIVHTTKDAPDLVSPAALVEIAACLDRFIRETVVS